MRDKFEADVDAVLKGVGDGMTLLVGGFGGSGVPYHLIHAVAERGLHDLTLVANNCGTGEHGLSELFGAGCVRRVVASFPTQDGNNRFLDAYHRGEVEVELVPQGTLVERLHAGASGLGGVLTPTGVGTILAAGRQLMNLNGRTYVLELPMRGDVALVHASVADHAGNLRFRRSARNFNRLMAMAADLTIVEADKVVETGCLDPDDIHTAGVFVDWVTYSGDPV